MKQRLSHISHTWIDIPPGQDLAQLKKEGYKIRTKPTKKKKKK